MTPKVKNILIFTTIAVVFILIYIFFIKPSPEQPSLVSSPATTLPNIDGSPLAVNNPDGTSGTEDFLALLLNVQGIKLDTTIFDDPGFISLRDSSIMLVPDNTEGRPNPFAQIGNDAIAQLTCTPPQVLNTTTNTCVNPTPVTCVPPQILNAVTNTCVSPATN